MADTALSTAFNGNAPQDERSQAMTEAQAAAMPCSKCGVVKLASEFYRRKDRVVRACKECCKLSSRTNHKKNRAENIEKMKARYLINKEAQAAYMRRYREENSHALKAKKREYATRTKSEQALRMSRWKKDNKGAVKCHDSIRRALKNKATVSWSVQAKIQSVYSEAVRLRQLGFNVHVDHRVPLRSPMLQSLRGNLQLKGEFIGPLLPVVQGFHTEDNLTVISARDNIGKHNRYWPNMPVYENL